MSLPVVSFICFLIFSLSLTWIVYDDYDCQCCFAIYGFFCLGSSSIHDCKIAVIVLYSSNYCINLVDGLLYCIGGMKS